MAFTLTLQPDIEERLRTVAHREHRSVHKTVELAVEEYLERRDHREEVLRIARQVFERHKEFFEMLGDR
jgi:predicted transcriptional regulator